MNADFIAVLDYWEREKGISREVLVAAVQEALLAAAKKAVGPARELSCEIDSKTGDIKAFAKLVVADKVLSKHDQISIFDARKIKADVQVGEEVLIEVTPASENIEIDSPHTIMGSNPVAMRIIAERLAVI